MHLSIRDLAGERGGKTVFSGVSLELGSGGLAIVAGPNGSGKSTLLQILAGLLPAAHGSVTLGGGSAERNELADCAHYLGHQNGMKPTLTVAENLSFWREFLGEPLLSVPEALERVGLREVSGLPLGYLSTGQKRRIAIARLLVARRPVWLLDEPTAGLDAASERQFAALMRDHLSGGGMIVAATHLPLGIEGAVDLRLGET